MRKKKFAIVGLLLFTACTSEFTSQLTRLGENVPDDFLLNSPASNGIQFTGAEEISNQLSVTCIGEDQLPHTPRSWEDIIISYGAVLHKTVFVVDVPSTENDKYRAFIANKGKHVVSLIDSLEMQEWGYPNYIYAGIVEGAQIYADRPLFGRETGASLNEFFSVQPNSYFRVTYPDYLVAEYRSPVEGRYRCSFDSFHAKGTALTFCNLLMLDKRPSEQYEEITFTIEIPIECEYMQQIVYGEDYPESYYEQGLVERNENRVLRGSVTVRFDE